MLENDATSPVEWESKLCEVKDFFILWDKKQTAKGKNAALAYVYLQDFCSSSFRCKKAIFFVHENAAHG